MKGAALESVRKTLEPVKDGVQKSGQRQDTIDLSDLEEKKRKLLEKRISILSLHAPWKKKTGNRPRLQHQKSDRDRYFSEHLNSGSTQEGGDNVRLSTKKKNQGGGVNERKADDFRQSATLTERPNKLTHERKLIANRRQGWGRGMRAYRTGDEKIYPRSLKKHLSDASSD